MELAPIALFIYNRPHYLLVTLESLYRNELAKDSLLIIYADGVKDGASEVEVKQIEEARSIAKSKNWCREVRIVERSKNLGLSTSIISGVSETLQEFGKVIVLEDDLELSPYFLNFMNDALNIYADEPGVLSIGACNYFATDENIPETFFIPIPDCLGWATWRNRWASFEPNGQILLQQLTEKGLLNSFNLNGAYDFEGMLRNQIEGKTQSWAIRWQALSFTQNRLNLYPKYALTNHIGIDKSATNSAGVDYSNATKFPMKQITVKKKPIVTEDIVMTSMFNYYEKNFVHGRSLTGLRKKAKILVSKLTPSFVKKLYKSM